MKTYKITPDILNDIFSNEENIEYLLWSDDSEITKEDIMSQFHITIYDNFQFNLEHNEDDFRIENIVLADMYHENEMEERY